MKLNRPLQIKTKSKYAILITLIRPIGNVGILRLLNQIEGLKKPYSHHMEIELEETDSELHDLINFIQTIIRVQCGTQIPDVDEHGFFHKDFLIITSDEDNVVAHGVKNRSKLLAVRAWLTVSTPGLELPAVDLYDHALTSDGPQRYVLSPRGPGDGNPMS